MNFSRASNLPKTWFQLSAGLTLKHWIKFSVEPTIFEPRLKFKPRLKFFKFGLWTRRLSWTTCASWTEVVQLRLNLTEFNYFNTVSPLKSCNYVCLDYWLWFATGVIALTYASGRKKRSLDQVAFRSLVQFNTKLQKHRNHF